MIKKADLNQKAREGGAGKPALSNFFAGAVDVGTVYGAS